jgi:hypothetical protein
MICPLRATQTILPPKRITAEPTEALLAGLGVLKNSSTRHNLLFLKRNSETYIIYLGFFYGTQYDLYDQLKKYSYVIGKGPYVRI